MFARRFETPAIADMFAVPVTSCILLELQNRCVNVGLGIGGMAAAVGLGLAGHEVIVLEGAPAVYSPRSSVALPRLADAPRSAKSVLGSK